MDISTAAELFSLADRSVLITGCTGVLGSDMVRFLAGCERTPARVLP